MKKRLVFVTTAIAASLALTGTAFADPEIPTPGLGAAGCGVKPGKVGVLGPNGAFYWSGGQVDLSDCLVMETR